MHLSLGQKENTGNRFNVCAIFVFYWIVLIIWQNAFGAQNRGVADAIVKVILLGYLLFSFFRVRTCMSRKNLILLLVFIFSQFTTFVLCDADNVSLGVLVHYIYPSLVILLVLCIGNDFLVTQKQVDSMNGYILVVIVVSILYTLFFEPEQYTVAINAQHSGYGNELCSFFTSMYEYALYLFYGITVCINRIVDKKRKSGLYYILFIAFFCTMIFTFSRTAIVGCVAYLLIYAVLNIKERISKVIILAACVCILVVLVHPVFYNYIYQVVWKSGEVSTRERLFALAFDYYDKSSLLNQLFGHGITETRLYFMTLGDYGSIHNGYLQVLIYYGAIGLIFLVSYLMSTLYRCIKFFRFDRNTALSALGMLAFCMITMLPTTLVIFSSSIDCYFLTMMLLIVPKYQMNAIIKRVYY